MKTKVYLGGTCGSAWRDTLMPRLQIEYFNPMVEDWTPESQAEEERQREHCDICLYVITPKMLGVFGVAEVVDDSNKRPGKTLFCFVEDERAFGGDAVFEPHQIKALNAVGKMVEGNGARWVRDFAELEEVLNGWEKV